VRAQVAAASLDREQAAGMALRTQPKGTNE
jgi:hypothetical protein